MKHESYTSVAGYKCPLCGTDQVNPLLWQTAWNTELWVAYDVPTCCNVHVGFAFADGMALYVGTFRGAQELRDWFNAAGQISHEWPVGMFWDPDEQTPLPLDPYEIPI